MRASKILGGLALVLALGGCSQFMWPDPLLFKTGYSLVNNSPYTGPVTLIVGDHTTRFQAVFEGGSAPFTLAVLGPGERELATAEGTSITFVPFISGRYTVVLTDSVGQTLTWQIDLNLLVIETGW